MPRGYWSIILAAVGWLILAAAPAPDNQASAKQADTAQRVEQSLHSIANAQNEIAASTNAGEYQQPCDDAEYDNRSDLCAQWYAARAARDAADWAFWALGVGIIGACGIVAALLLTIDSNRIARDTARRQLRAYISFESGAISDIKIGEKVVITFQFKNAGQTPGYITAAAVGIDFEKMPVSAAPTLSPEAKQTASSEGPGSVFYHNAETARGPTEAEVAAYEAGTHAFVGSCDVQYSDVFGKKWRTLVSVYRAEGRNLAPNQISVLSFGNDAT